MPNSINYISKPVNKFTYWTISETLTAFFSI